MHPRRTSSGDRSKLEFRSAFVGTSFQENIISNCVLLQAALPIKSQLDPEQYGSKPSGYGIQGAVYKAQSFARKLEGNIILKIDFKNAFNSINRTACMLTLETLEPDYCPWASWCIKGSSHVSFKSTIFLRQDVIVPASERRNLLRFYILS